VQVSSVLNSNLEQWLDGDDLRIRFFLQGDRYAHEIWLREGDVWAPVLRSVEGSASDDWPASPPFQSLHIDERSGTRSLALLVGMAGKSHWSASVQLDPAGRQASFDVACRVRGVSGRLTSSYRLVEPRSSEAFMLDPTGQQATCGLARPSEPSIQFQIYQEHAPVQLSHNGGELMLLAEDAGLQEQARTVRWRYDVRLTS
jgi:hypothetical protein